MSIEVKDITYTYMKNTPFERTALRHVSLTLEEGSFMAVAGHTGSGKSTLMQHLNGLLQPTSGEILVDGVSIAGKSPAARAARSKVGMVFQYPEHQLFEETVAADIAFGPKNMGLSAEKIGQRVREAMEFVGLDYEKYHTRSPFQLSGGQMRRAAIAGVIAMQPKYLVLDEPTAGLDPRGREDLLQQILKLHKKQQVTILLVSHNMDDIARVADQVVFMEQGEILVNAPPREAFFAKDEIQRAGLAVPQITALLEELQAKGLPVDVRALSIEEGTAHILQALRGNGAC